VKHRSLVAVSAALLLIGLPGLAAAQGLIWSLPADGAWVNFEGDYQEVLFDPTGTKVPTIEDARTAYQCGQQNIAFAKVMCWRRNVTLKSVGREQGTFRGAEVDCRWIEIKTVTKPVGAAVDPGPLGTRIVKVLVPEKEIGGGTVDAQGIPVQFVPIVSGWQKIGNAEATPITGNVLQVYPLMTLVAQYRRVTEDPAAGDPGLLAGIDAGTTTAVKGELIIESKTDRSENTAILWRSDTIPFGLAKWDVTVIRETKDATSERERFLPKTRLTVTMTATSTGTDAVSEIVVPGT
jgi:hypothetical protein